MKKYRRLHIREIVRHGDEYYASDKCRWLKCTKQSIGLKVQTDYDALIACQLHITCQCGTVQVVCGKETSCHHKRVAGQTSPVA